MSRGLGDVYKRQSKSSVPATNPSQSAFTKKPVSYTHLTLPTTPYV
ncbi:hypothetical protein JMUB7552_27590 [Staphylococcus aureus]